VEWAADAIATSKPGGSVAALAARRLARKRAIEQKERFAPVYQAMRRSRASRCRRPCSRAKRTWQ